MSLIWTRILDFQLRMHSYTHGIVTSYLDGHVQTGLAAC